jgi:lysophospholipase L1-like esterase
LPLFRRGVVSRVHLGALASTTLVLALGAGLPSAHATAPPELPPERAPDWGDLAGLRPMLKFLGPQAAVASAPTTATLAIDGPAGTFYVPYIQTSADLPVTLTHNGPANRSIVDVILDAGTPRARAVRLTGSPWQTTFHAVGFGEHTLTARLYVPEEGIPAGIALQAPPVAEAHLEQVARGDVIAALGDSTTEGLGEGPWQPGEQELLGFFPDWLAARRSLQSSRRGWISSDGRNFPQAGLSMHPASRPAFVVELARQLAAARGHPVLVLNDGWSGMTSDGYMRVSTSGYFAGQMAAASPNAWLVNLGVNDPLVNSSPAEYANRMQALVDNLEKLYGAPAQAIHVACPIYASQPMRNRAEAQYLPEIDMLRARANLGPAPDFFAFYRDHPENVADAVHPNFVGYSAMARLWGAALAGQGQACSR